VPTHGRAALGIGYMPEDRGLVPQLTVEENVLLPLWVNSKLDRASRLALAWKLLPEVEAMRDRRALLLSGGQQKLVALARALVVGTRLLLLDEPFEGVAPALAQRLVEVIGALQDSELAVLIAQSDAQHGASLFARSTTIERGANAAVAEVL
jgi:branched-chain amino acid transport system ATP-binding protein